jgi:hypothetical protein
VAPYGRARQKFQIRICAFRAHNPGNRITREWLYEESQDSVGVL